MFSLLKEFVSKVFNLLEPTTSSEKGKKKVRPAKARKNIKVTGHRKTGLGIFQNLIMKKLK